MAKLNPIQLITSYKRWFKFEFWPFWILYIPAYLYWVILAIKAKHPTYFTTTNPMMNNSGAVNLSKEDYLSKLPPTWIPKTLKINANVTIQELKHKVSHHQFSYPLILKPTNAERGKGVVFIETENQLITALEANKYPDLLLQEYCSYSQEAGILYYRYPTANRGTISSITTKVFCTLTGDGQSTWGELMARNERIVHRKKQLQQQFAPQWETIAKKGEQLLVEPIGSHNRGTLFLNGHKHFSSELVCLLDHWAKQLPGFYYGRFDIKFNTWEGLLKHEDFALIEINGVNAEPTHIYDPKITLMEAYRIIFSHMKIIYEISRQNRRLGHSPKPLLPFIIELIKNVTR